MKLFNFGKAKKNKQNTRTIIKEYYGGDTARFLINYTQNIYNIPEVRTAIETFGDIFSSIPKRHERVSVDGNVEYINDSISRVISLKPNPLQNATQFWKNLSTSLMLNNNVFVEQIVDSSNGELKKLYVLPNTVYRFDLINESRATVTFPEINKTYDLDNLIYINRFPSLRGGANNNLGLYETVLQALATQAVNIADPKKVRALISGRTNQMNPNMKERDTKGVMNEIGLSFDNSVKGVAYLDSQWQVTPINWQENDVNRALMELVKNTVYNYFGISDAIINNKASELEYSMFVANKIEPLARQIEQEFTNKLFTAKEVGYGNKIVLDTFKLQVSTLSAKTALFSIASRQGLMNNDEMRDQLGLPPIPDGYGKMFRVTADTIDITKVNEYQAAQKGAKKAPGKDDDKKTDKEVDSGKKSDI